MRNLFLAAGLALSLLPLTASAAPHHTAKPSKMAATMYQCQKCHMKVSAAVAKKDGYKDPMDGGKLVPMMAAPAKAAPMGSMKM